MLLLRTAVALRLLEAGATVDQVSKEQGYTALIFAACNGWSCRCLDSLYTKLQVAVGDLELVTELVALGADIGLRCMQGDDQPKLAQLTRCCCRQDCS